MATNNEVVLDAKRVTIRFGGLMAVCEFDLTIRAHELVGLIGPNGAGKTTLLNAICGIQRPQQGAIQLDGTTIVGRKPSDIAQLGLCAPLGQLHGQHQRAVQPPSTTSVCPVM